MSKMIGWLIAGGVTLWVALALLGGVGIYAIAHHKEPVPVTNVYITDKIPQGPRPIVNVTDKVTVNVKEEPAPVVNVYPEASTTNVYPTMVFTDDDKTVSGPPVEHYPTMHERKPAPHKEAAKERDKHEHDPKRHEHRTYS